MTQSLHPTPTQTDPVESIKWKLQRPGSGTNVKAFSGAGRTLGDGATVGGGATLGGGANDGQALEDELHNLDEVSHILLLYGLYNIQCVNI